MTSTPRPDPDPGLRRFSTRRLPALRVTRGIEVFIDNSVEPEEFTLFLGRDGSGSFTHLSRDEIVALAQVLADPDSWPRRYAGWVDR